MLNESNTDVRLKEEIIKTGCIEVKTADKGDTLIGYIVNKNGSKEAKVVGITVVEPSLSANQAMINTAVKNKTIELGILLTPNKTYYFDMSSAMPIEKSMMFVSHTEYVTSEEGINKFILRLMDGKRGKTQIQNVSNVITAICVRRYMYDNGDINKWLSIDLDTFNKLADEIVSKYQISSNILTHIKEKIELENLKIALEPLIPKSIYYSKLIEDIIRKISPKDLIVTTPNMVNVVSEFIKILNINGKYGELGSGLGCILREVGRESNYIKGIEIDKNISDISKILNIISGKENIEIQENDALQIEEVEKYDLTIVEPPMGQRVDKSKYKDKYLVARNSNIVNLSDLLIEKSINMTKEDGYIVAVVNDGSLYTNQSKALRKLITHETIIKAIVSLPDHIQKPYSVVKMSIIIMKKKISNLDYCENVFIDEIKKLDEINDVCQRFADFLKNNMNENNFIDYNALYESDNWTSNYLKMFEELSSEDRYPLVDICEINSKGIKSLNHTDKNYSYIEVSNIDTENKILQDIKVVNFSGLPTRAKLVAYPGDIVISTTRPDKGAVAIVPDDSDVYIVSSALAVLTPKKISSEVLYFILSSDKITQELAALASGTAVPMISTKQLKEYKLPINKVTEEYKKEAKELYCKIVSTFEHHKTLNEIIEEELSKVDKDSKRSYRLSEIISYKRPEILNESQCIKQVKIANLCEDSIYINSEDLDLLEDKKGRHNLISNNDVLIPRMIDNLERTSVATEDINGCISNQFIYTYITNECVVPEYIAMLLRYNSTKSKINKLLSQNNTKLMIKRNILEGIDVIIPSINQQKRVISEVFNKSSLYNLDDVNNQIEKFQDKLCRK